MIPLYTVGNKASKDLGKANFERAIEKAEKAIARHSIKKKPEWNKSRRKQRKILNGYRVENTIHFYGKRGCLWGGRNFIRVPSKMLLPLFLI